MLSANPNVARLALTEVRVGLFALFLAACATKTAPTQDDAAAVAKARAALAPFESSLKAELGEALALAPEHAIEVCSARAPELAREHSTKDVRVGRSALRLRNAENAPPAWLLPVMEDLAKTPSGSTGHRVVRLPDGGWGYAEPIWVSAPCLTCHGEKISPALEDELRVRYPDDTARAFHVGDFRGVFFAEVRAK